MKAGMSTGRKTVESTRAAILVFFCCLAAGCSPGAGERIEEDIDLPFVDDPQIIGTWRTVDYVESVESFDPEHIQWQDELFLKELTFFEDGATSMPAWTWTKGYVLDRVDKTAAHYYVREIREIAYLFVEWKSGDYTIRHQAPYFYVLCMAADPAVA
jgi:bla regulator protein BlaR1